jgi:hypothetical protein
MQMKPYKTAFLLIALAVGSLAVPAAETDTAAELVRINAAVTAAYAAQRDAEIQRHIARALIADASEQSGGLASLKSLGLSVDEAIPTYRALIKDGGSTARELALHHIANHAGGAANGLSQEILQIIRDPNTGANILAAAAGAAAAITPSTAGTAAAVANLLDKALPDHATLAVLKALRSMGSAAGPAVPKVQPHLTSHNSAVQFHAFSAIGEIKGAPDGKLQQAVAKGSVDGLPVEDQYGVLKSLGNKPESKALLVKAADDKRAYIQATALQSLGVVGKSDKAAVRAMLSRISSSDEFISRTAAEALAAIDASNAGLVDVLSEGLANSNHAIRHSAANGLRRFGVAAKPALPALSAALRDIHEGQNVSEIGAYLEVVRSLGSDGKEAAPAILDLLPERSVVYRNRDKFTTHYLRAFMLLTLIEIGTLDQAAPFILDGLANSQGHLYAVAARAAARSPQLWQQSVPFLTRSLQPDFPDHFLTFERFFARFSSDDQYTSAKIEAIRALGQMGPAAKSASPLLAEIAAERPEFMGNASLIADEATKALRAVGN